MKKWYLLPLITVCMLFWSKQSFAQYTFANHVETGITLPASGVMIPFSTASQNVNIGNNAYVPFHVISGSTYHFDVCSTVNYDSYMTAWNSASTGTNAFFDDDGCACASGCGGTFASTATWASTFTGNLYVQLNVFGFNGTWSCGTTTVPAGNLCGSTSSYGSTVLHYQCTLPTLITDGTAGSNAWNVFAYNSQTIGTNYSGYYTMSTLNFDTRLGQTNSNTQSWNQSTQGPSWASGYKGCDVGIDNMSYRFKRTGFPCGNYTIQIVNDDNGVLLINGTSVSAPGCCNSTFATAWSGYLGPNSTVELQIVEGGGDSYGGLAFILGSALAVTSGAGPVCPGSTLALTDSHTAGSGNATPTWSITSNTSPTSSVSGTTFTAGAVTGANQSATVQVSEEGCTATQAVTVTGIPALAQGTAGNGTWNVFCYNSGDATGGSGSWTTNYVGYYSQSALNADSRSVWTSGGNPSTAPGYSGCTVNASNNSWRYVRTNIACGAYQLQIDHDDVGTILINGTQVYTNAACCASQNAGTFAIATSDIIEYRTANGGGGSYSAITFNSAAALSAGTVAYSGSTTACTGYDPPAFTSTAAASGGASAAVTNGTTAYQWQLNGANIGGATSASYDPPVLSTVGSYAYTRIATDRCSATSTATGATIVVSAQPTIAVSGGNVTVCNGATVTLTGTPSGGTGTATYQWQSSTTTGGTYANVATGGTSATYNPVTTSNGTLWYRVLISYSGSSCGTNVVSSNNQSVTVNAQPTITVSGGNVTVCNGATVTLTGTPSGGTGTATYQWQSATSSGGTYSNVATGGTSATYNPVTTSNGTLFYQVLISYSGSGCSSNVPSSNNQSVTVNAQPTITITGGDITVCNAATVTLTGTPSNGAGTASYQWQSSTSTGGTYTNVASGGTSATYNPVTTTNGTLWYRVLISYSGSNCSSNVVSTNTTFVTVNAQPTITVSGGNVTVCNGATVTLTGTPSNGTGTASYQWQSATSSGGTYTNVATGGTSSTYSPVTTSNGTLFYQVLISYSGSGCSSNVPSSNNQSVTVNAQPSAGTLSPTPAQGTVCTGTVSATLSAGSDGAGTIADVLQYRFDGGTWTTYISGNGLNTSGHTSVDIQTFRTATGSNCTTSSANTVSWTIVAQPIAGTLSPSPAAGVTCLGTSVSATLTAGSAGTGTVTDVLEYRFDGGSYTAYTSGSSITTTGHTSVDIHTFRTATGGNCNTSSTNTVSWTFSNPTAFTVTGGGTFCSGGTGVTVGLNGSQSGVTYQLFINGTGGTTASGTGSSISFGNQTTGGTYTVVATNNATSCQTNMTGSVTVTVNTLSTDPTSASVDHTNYCPGAFSNITLSYTGGTLGTGAVATWYATGCASGGSIGTGNNLVISSPSTSTTYYVRFEGTCNNTNCVNIASTVKTLSTDPTSLSNNTNNTCTGSSVNLNVIGGSLGTGAEWKLYSVSCGGTLESQNGSGSFTVNPTTSIQYFARAEGDCNNSLCANVVITVSATPSTAATSLSASSTSTCPGDAVTLTTNGGALGASAEWYLYAKSSSTACVSLLAGTQADHNGTGIFSVAPSTTTFYYVRAENNCGATNCTGVSVTVNPAPATTSVSGAGAFCASTTITASGGSGGTIYFQGTTSGGTSTATASTSQSITSSGTYYFRSQSAAGCWGPEGSASVTINPVPAAVTVSGGGTFCATAALTASGGSGGTIYYQGTTSGGTSTATASSSQTVNATGTYYFRSESAAGCWGTEGSGVVTIDPGPFTVSTWTGTVDGNWFNADNWTQCVPGANTVVTIPGSLSNYPNVFGSDPLASSITVNSGGSITLNAGRTLTVGSDITVNGTLTMSASSTITMAGNWNSQGTLNGGNGTITFTGTGTSTITTNTSGSTFNHITVNKTGTAKVTLANDITSSGTLNVTNGVFEVPTGKTANVSKVSNGTSGTINVNSSSRINIVP